MLILGADELQIRPNGGRREESRLYSVDGLLLMVILIRERGIRHS